MPQQSLGEQRPLEAGVGPNRQPELFGDLRAPVATALLTMGALLSGDRPTEGAALTYEGPGALVAGMDPQDAKPQAGGVTPPPTGAAGAQTRTNAQRAQDLFNRAQQGNISDEEITTELAGIKPLDQSRKEEILKQIVATAELARSGGQLDRWNEIPPERRAYLKQLIAKAVELKDSIHFDLKQSEDGMLSLDCRIRVIDGYGKPVETSVKVDMASPALILEGRPLPTLDKVGAADAPIIKVNGVQIPAEISLSKVMTELQAQLREGVRINAQSVREYLEEHYPGGIPNLPSPDEDDGALADPPLGSGR